MSTLPQPSDEPPSITDPAAPLPGWIPQLVLLDLDGTCIAHGEGPHPDIVAAIAAARERAHVTIATGRAYPSVLPWAVKLGIREPLICGQGAAIREMPPQGAEEPPGRLLSSNPIPALTARDAVLLARRHGWPVVLDAGLELYAEAAAWPREREAPRSQAVTVLDDATTVVDQGLDRVIVILRDHLEEADSAEREIRREMAGRAEVTRSTPAFIEITDLSATKGQALRRLADHLGVDPALSVAVGDGYNDLDVLDAAGFAVAIDQSVPEVLAHADAVCGGPDAAGVADVLRALRLA